MSLEVKKAVLECSHCRVTNSTSSHHDAQQVIGALNADKPFDIINMDIWHLGQTHTDSKYTNIQKASLTTKVCNTTRFAFTAFMLIVNLGLDHQTGIFPNFLNPKLIIIDKASKFKGVLTTDCETIGVKYYMWCHHQKATTQSYLNNFTGTCLNKGMYIGW
jgi:hypothetical protein